MAAAVRAGVRAQVSTSPAPMISVAAPGTPIRAAANRPGSSWPARTGSNANRAGSTVSSTPKTSSDIRSHPAVRTAYATMVTSAVSAVEVKRRANRPASTARTIPSP